MKIVIDGRFLFSPLISLGRYVYELSRHLLEIDNQNKYVIYANENCNPELSWANLESSNLTTRTVPCNPMGVFQQAKIPLELLQDRPDVYHYPHFDMPLAHPFKSVVTIHDLKYLLFPEFFPKGGFLKRSYIWTMMRLSLQRASMVIAVSKNTKQDIIDVFGTPSNKIRVIHESASSFAGKIDNLQSLRRLKEKYGIEKEFILYVGENRLHKNLDRMIEAFSAIGPEREGIQFVIAGKIDKRFAKETGVIRRMRRAGGIVYLGSVSDRELQLLYNYAKFLVFATLYEGFGLPVLEAMACGCPVITSNVSSLPEIAGDAALQVDPRKPGSIQGAMEMLLRDEGLRRELIHKGWRQKNRFSWNIAAKEALTLYSNLI